MSRRRLRFAAWCAMLAVVLTQLATAAYACPRIEEALQAPPAREDTVTPCAQMEMDGHADSALCIEHCNAGHKLVGNPPVVEQAAATPVIVLFVPVLSLDMHAREAPVEPLLARASAPPPFASSHRLRI